MSRAYLVGSQEALPPASSTKMGHGPQILLFGGFR